MKKISYIFLFCLVILSCSKSDKIEEENSLYGNWKLEASVISDGGSTYITPIDNGQTINLRSDNTFEILNTSIECSSGNYTITEDSPQNFNMDIISLICDNGSLIKYAFSFEERKLLLSFIASDGSTGCDEMCAERYVKVSDE